MTNSDDFCTFFRCRLKDHECLLDLIRKTCYYSTLVARLPKLLKLNKNTRAAYISSVVLENSKQF
jgi:hypothetical protein